MELDEIIYSFFVKRFSRRKKRQLAIQPHVVKLSDVHYRLTVMARTMTGKPIEIFPAELEGGYKDLNFFLPESVSWFSDYNQNLHFYYYRIAYLSIQFKFQLNWPTATTGEPPKEASRNISIQNSHQILHIMQYDYPYAYGFWLEYVRHNEKQIANQMPVIESYWLYGKWMKNSIGDSVSSEALTGFDSKHVLPEEGITTTIKAKAAEEIKLAEIDKKQQEDYVLTHNFEKVETAEEFDGIWRDFDGADELKEQQDAIDELHMKWVVRTHDPTHSIYQAEFVENASLAESADTKQTIEPVLYPEWDFRKNSYRENFCSVFPQKSISKQTGFALNTLQEYRSIWTSTRKYLANLNNKSEKFRRQIDGKEFDIDSLTDFYTDRMSGKSPDEKIYISDRIKKKDLSVLILIDASLSSDAYVNGEKILNIEKYVSVLFGELLSEFSVDFSIASFYSQTRNYTSFSIVKAFEEEWVSSRDRVGGIEPCGYTRIGPALRHAASLLQKRSATRKWILLISDGKPNDYDRYEGRHGIQDVRQALYEIRQSGMHSFAFAVESEARYYLPQMFGSSHYRIQPTTQGLLLAMTSMLGRLIPH